MKKFRFSLGKRPDTTVNLVTNGTFTGGLTGWTAGSQWSAVSNTAECYSAGTSDFSTSCLLRQNGLLAVGSTYQLSYDLKKATSHSDPNNGRVSFSMGGQYYAPYKDYEENSTTSFINYVHRNQLCAHGNDFLFFCFGNTRDNCAIDNVLLYREVWNDPLEYDPIQWDEMEIVKKRDDALNGLIFQYIAGVTFIGDGYDYLYNEYIDNGYCGEVPVRVEQLNHNGNSYDLFFEGKIYINKCKFNTFKRQVEVDIEEKGSAMEFIGNKDIKISMLPSYNQDYANNYPSDAPTTLMSIDFNNDAGAYPAGGVYENQIVFRVYDCLRKIIMVSSNYRLDFDSTFFNTSTYQYFGISIAGYLCPVVTGSGLTNDDFKLSLSELFEELNRLFNLSFSIDRSGVIPKVVIEPKIDFYNSTTVLSLSNPIDVELDFYNQNIYKAVNIGYENVDDTPTNKNFNTPEGNQYFTSNNCATNTLNLVSRFIQKSTVLKNLLNLTITDTKYCKNWYWIETTGTQTKNSGSGTYDYNTNIEEADNIARQVVTLASSFLKATSGVTTPIDKSNIALVSILSFSYPITKSEFDSIDQAFDTIEVNGKESFLLEGKYKVKNGLTEFKLLTS